MTMTTSFARSFPDDAEYLDAQPLRLSGGSLGLGADFDGLFDHDDDDDIDARAFADSRGSADLDAMFSSRGSAGMDFQFDIESSMNNTNMDAVDDLLASSAGNMSLDDLAISHGSMRLSTASIGPRPSRRPSRRQTTDEAMKPRAIGSIDFDPPSAVEATAPLRHSFQSGLKKMQAIDFDPAPASFDLVAPASNNKEDGQQEHVLQQQPLGEPPRPASHVDQGQQQQQQQPQFNQHLDGSQRSYDPALDNSQRSTASHGDLSAASYQSALSQSQPSHVTQLAALHLLLEDNDSSSNQRGYNDGLKKLAASMERTNNTRRQVEMMKRDVLTPAQRAALSDIKERLNNLNQQVQVQATGHSMAPGSPVPPGKASVSPVPQGSPAQEISRQHIQQVRQEMVQQIPGPPLTQQPMGGAEQRGQRASGASSPSIVAAFFSGSRGTLTNGLEQSRKQLSQYMGQMNGNPTLQRSVGRYNSAA